MAQQSGTSGMMMSSMTSVLTFSAHRMWMWMNRLNGSNGLTLLFIWPAESNPGCGVWFHQSAVLWHLHHGAHLPQHGDHDGGNGQPESREGGFPLQSERGFHYCLHWRVCAKAFCPETVFLHQRVEYFRFCCGHLVNCRWVSCADIKGGTVVFNSYTPVKVLFETTEHNRYHYCLSGCGHRSGIGTCQSPSLHCEAQSSSSIGHIF